MGILYIFLHFGGYFGIFFQYFLDIFFLHFFLPSKLFFSYIFLHFARYFGILVDTSFKLTYHQMLCFAFPGYDDEKSLLMSQKSLERRFRQSPVFIAATFMEQGGIPPSTNPATLLKEAIHVISCGYEDKTE